jgi:hypothetical protein
MFKILNLFLLLPILLFAQDKYTFRLQWDLNTEPDMDHYEIWQQQISQVDTGQVLAQKIRIATVTHPITEYIFFNFPDTLCVKFYITAVDTNGNVSGFSKPAFYMSRFDVNWDIKLNVYDMILYNGDLCSPTFDFKPQYDYFEDQKINVFDTIRFYQFFSNLK